MLADILTYIALLCCLFVFLEHFQNTVTWCSWNFAFRPISRSIKLRLFSRANDACCWWDSRNECVNFEQNLEFTLCFGRKRVKSWPRNQLLYFHTKSARTRNNSWKWRKQAGNLVYTIRWFVLRLVLIPTKRILVNFIRHATVLQINSWKYFWMQIECVTGQK